MDFRFNEEQEKFRLEVRSFLQKELSEEHHQEALCSGGLGFGYNSRDFLKKLGAKGWLGVDWPVEYGGLGKTIWERFIIYEELGYARGPWPGVGGTISAPMILHLGTEEQKKFYVPRVASGEFEFTLGYTEPQAGSDLAGLEIRAVEEGDYFIMNGQKMFNSTAHYGDYHWLGARTDFTVAKHQGISLFIVDLKSPGITIRPLYTMSGIRTNEVFYDNVKVPGNNLVGKKNRGFYHIMEALDWERIYATGDMKRSVEEMTKFIRNGPPGISINNSKVVLARLAEIAIEVEITRLFSIRVIWLLSKKVAPAAEASMLKYYGDELRQRVSALGMQILGTYSQLQHGSKRALMNGAMETMYRAAVFMTLSAGTSEIQRNIIALRGLGLPR